MYKKIIFIGMVFVLLFTGCQNQSAEINVLIQEKNMLESEIQKLNEELEKNQKKISGSPLLLAIEINNLLKNQNMEYLSEYVHPEKGLLFSPYTYINQENCLVFNSSQLKELPFSKEKYTWGSFDGSGEPIIFDFQEYYDRFIYDHDYTDPQIIGNNFDVSFGNTINNIKEIFPESHFIEFHFKGFEQKYEGMDWRSLKIVLEKYDNSWYLVAIVHDEWTI